MIKIRALWPGLPLLSRWKDQSGTRGLRLAPGPTRVIRQASPDGIVPGYRVVDAEYVHAPLRGKLQNSLRRQIASVWLRGRM